MTLRKRLMLWYAGLLVVMIVIVGAGSFAIMRWTMIASVDATLEETIKIVEENSRLIAIPVLGGSKQIELELLELNYFLVSGIEVQVWKQDDGQFNLEDASANLRSYEHALDPDSLGSTDVKVINNVTLDDMSWRVRTSPIFDNQGQFVGNIQVAGSLGLINKAAERLFFFMVLMCLVVIAVAMVLSVRLAKWVMKPVEDMTAAALEISKTKNLTTRLEWESADDDLRKLTDAFNQMMARLEDLFNAQQQMIMDVSHELRTPLTVICGNLEMMKKLDNANYNEDLKSIQAEAERMKQLVKELLRFTRLDLEKLKVELLPTDLDSLLMETYQDARQRLLRDSDIEFTLAHVEPLKINGHSDWIKQVLLSLMDNAIKFTTSDGGKVRVSLRRQDKNAVIEVQDNGIGIPQKDLHAIFNRFYQVDSSRTHNGRDWSFGLGLSMAESIIDAHNGRIEVESVLGQGSTFKVYLPIYDPLEADTGLGEHEAPTQQSAYWGGLKATTQETRAIKTETEQ